MATGQNGIATFKNVAALPTGEFKPLNIPNRSGSVWDTSLCVVGQNFPILSSTAYKESENNPGIANVKGYTHVIKTKKEVPSNKCVKYSNIIFSKQDLYSTTRAIQISNLQRGYGGLSVSIGATVYFDDHNRTIYGSGRSNYETDRPIESNLGGVFSDALKWKDNGQGFSWFDSEDICANKVVLNITVNVDTSGSVHTRYRNIEFIVTDISGVTSTNIMELDQDHKIQWKSLTFTFNDSGTNSTNLPLEIQFITA